MPSLLMKALYFLHRLVSANRLEAINFETHLVKNLILHHLSPAVTFFLFHATSVGDTPCQFHLATSLNTKLEVQLFTSERNLKEK